jgi:hypothetical protein
MKTQPLHSDSIKPDSDPSQVNKMLLLSCGSDVIAGRRRKNCELGGWILQIGFCSTTAQSAHYIGKMCTSEYPYMKGGEKETCYKYEGICL